MMGFRQVGGMGRLAFAGGLALMLAGCAGQTGTGQTGAGPFAGLRNPFGGLGVFDPDMRGRMGGPLDTSGAKVGGAPAAAGGVTDPFAGQGVRQAELPPATGNAAKPASGGAAVTVTPAAGAGGSAARSHTVVSGETAWSISRKYGVSVKDLAAANALPEAMTVRVGQRLAIPATGATVTAAVTAPGAGSPTPTPPSASHPLPSERTAPAAAPVPRPASPDLGATRTAASGSGKFRMPVNGSIVRTYSKGKNEGIDISAPAGTEVKAAGSGTVAAITRDTAGVPIVVIRHDGTLMTVYTGIDGLAVGKGDSVTAGQTIGRSTSGGIVHFEVRQGYESVDPEKYLG